VSARPNNKRGPSVARSRTTKRRVSALIAEAIVDAYTESEQRTAFYTLLDERLDTPFVTKILGIEVSVERIDMTEGEQIVAICRRGRSQQAVPILELPLPEPAPSGAEWIDAYRHWARGAGSGGS